MTLAEPLFVLLSIGLAVVGLSIVGAAVRAYAETERRGMIHLSLGFTLVVGATVATVLGALITDFEHTRTLLVVNNGFSMAGYAFVAYSIASYD
jgi:Na+/phosphate symporter